MLGETAAAEIEQESEVIKDFDEFSFQKSLQKRGNCGAFMKEKDQEISKELPIPKMDIPEMEKFEEVYKDHISSLLRAMNTSRCISEDNLPCKIEEGLYLGSLGAANNKSALKSLNVTHILKVANSFPPTYANDFVYKIVNIQDRPVVNISQYFDECFEFIDEAKKKGGSVLVHCFAGRSRSATIVIAYLMKKHGMSASQALEHVKSKRPVASPNFGFMQQLRDFEKTLQGSQSANEA